MSFYHQPRIVTNGLVFYMDAGNPNCYTGDGSIVYDLGPNKSDGSLGSTLFDINNKGSFVFGSHASALIMPDISAYSHTESHTYSAWIYPSIISGYKWIIANGAGGTGGTSLVITNSTIGFFYSGGGGVDSGNDLININEWTYVTTIFHSSPRSVSFYKNGIFDVSRTITSTWTAVNNNPMLASSWDSIFYYTGRIATAQIYNRALNDVEVLQNYNALKGRYGL